MSNDLAIQARGLGKRYLLGAAGDKHDTFRDLLVAGARSVLGRRNKKAHTEFWALRDASFDIRHGAENPLAHHRSDRGFGPHRRTRRRAARSRHRFSR